MIARYTGLFIAIAAPDLPSAPWHPAQFSPYSVPKSVTLLGRSGSSACVGRPGKVLHPASMMAVIDAIASSDLRLRQFNLVLVLAFLAQARCFDTGADGE
jgi:hypothetical protein